MFCHTNRHDWWTTYTRSGLQMHNVTGESSRVKSAFADTFVYRVNMFTMDISKIDMTSLRCQLPVYGGHLTNVDILHHPSNIITDRCRVICIAVTCILVTIFLFPVFQINPPPVCHC